MGGDEIWFRNWDTVGKGVSGIGRDGVVVRGFYGRVSWDTL